MKTSELIGPALEWAVAKGEATIGSRLKICPALSCGEIDIDISIWLDGVECRYAQRWAQGGPIIERIDGFQLKIWLESRPSSKCEAHIHNLDGDWIAFGPTPLVAAMRCLVASKLGDEIEIPEELS